MGDGDAHLGHVLVEERFGLGQILDARTDIEGLAAAIALAQQRLAHHDRIERRDEGAHRQPIDRRRGDDRHFAHAGQRQLQRARDRRRGQRQDVHLGAQLFQLLLVGDAEMLLLVDDDEAEVLELDRLAEKRVGADDDVDLAVGDALLHPGEFGCGNEPRGLADMHRIAAQPVGKGLHVLAREQRGRHHDRDLLAVHRGDEGGAQRHFGLAEADVAANEPVHRPAGGEIGEHGGDGGLLVVGLLVGKAGAELVIKAAVDGEPRRLAQLPLGGDLDQFARHLADAVLHPRLARLPGGRAEPVELDAGFFRAVARQKLDVLDRQEQFVAAGVMDFQAVVRRAGGLDGAQADEAADAVIDVDDDVAGGQARHLGDEILRALDLPARANEPLAQNVFFGDQRDIGGREAGIEAEHGERGLGAGERQRLRP